MTRKEYLFDLLKNACSRSAIIYEREERCVKLLDRIGKVVFIEKSRMLDLVEIQIDGWDRISDLKLLEELSKNGLLRMCESHQYNGEYCLSIMIKQ